MNGFRLIRQSNGNTTFFTCSMGTVEYSPKLKYRIEKKNAFDPATIHYRDPYREDAFALEVPIQPVEYAALLTFLTTEGIFYLEFDHNAVRKQFKVTIEALPKCPDDLHEYRDAAKFTLESRYTGTPPFIDFDNIIVPGNEDDEIII
jgi:hypothetical protein